MEADPFGMSDVLWRNTDDGRHFIVPARTQFPEGDYRATRFDGAPAQTRESWLRRFEVTETQAQDWAKQEFGAALSDIRQRIDRKLGRTRAVLDAARHAPVAPDAAVTADALPALFALAAALPRAILGSLSGDPQRLRDANGALADVQQRLNDAGIAVEVKLAALPDRLAALRRNLDRSDSTQDRR